MEQGKNDGFDSRKITHTHVHEVPHFGGVWAPASREAVATRGAHGLLAVGAGEGEAGVGELLDVRGAHEWHIVRGKVRAEVIYNTKATIPPPIIQHQRQNRITS